MSNGRKNVLKKEHIKNIKNLRLIDDLMFKVCFDRRPEAAEIIVKVATGIEDIKVLRARVQADLPNTKGKSPRLDLLAITNKGHVNIEVQCNAVKNLNKRARYYLSSMTFKMLKKGERYGSLRDAYVIFFLTYDIFGRGSPIYSFEMLEKKPGESSKTLLELHDGGHIIFVNCAYRGDDVYGRLANDMMARSSADINNPTLRGIVEGVKREEEGGSPTMSRMADRAYAEWEQRKLAEGEAKGEAREQRKIAAILIEGGRYTIDEISEITSLSIEELEGIKKKIIA